MPNWGEILARLNNEKIDNPIDKIRKEYLNVVHKYTNRNIITYYSSFLQKNMSGIEVFDGDKNAIMQAVHGLDKTKGLDLILHTPGGNLAATESLVYYLKRIFGNDIRAIIPQMAMSAGTMIALSCKEIIMGKQSNLGPIDPQFNGISCWGVMEEFYRAISEMRSDPATIPAWQVILSKYHPTFIGDCEKSQTWAENMVKTWLMGNMFLGKQDSDKLAETVVKVLGNHGETSSHSRHIHIEELKKLSLNVIELESIGKNKIDDCNDLQDAVLTLHHTYMVTFSQTKSVKIIENHEGNAMINLHP